MSYYLITGGNLTLYYVKLMIFMATCCNYRHRRWKWRTKPTEKIKLCKWHLHSDSKLHIKSVGIKNVYEMCYDNISAKVDTAIPTSFRLLLLSVTSTTSGLSTSVNVDRNILKSETANLNVTQRSASSCTKMLGLRNQRLATVPRA